MKVSTNTSIITKAYGETDAIKLLAECGFSALDLTMDDMWNENSPKLQKNYVSYAKKLKNLADGLGVVFNQAHAPFHSSFINEARTQKAYEIIARSIEFAALVGVPNIIVHPKQHLEYPQNAETLKQQNFEFYSSLIPLCKEYNINILIENMWRKKDGHITHSVCSSPKEFCEYIDMLNSPYIKACLDVGHAFLVNEDIPNMINTLNGRLYGLHIHDVAVDNDFHTVPYLASIDNWDDIIKSLANINYNGDLTLEIKRTDNIPTEILPQYLKFLHTVGENLKQKFLNEKIR